MPKNAIRTHADTLKFMKYAVKTMYGISETNYHGTPFEPLFGTGQGSGASPVVWLTLIVILMNTMDSGRFLSRIYQCLRYGLPSVDQPASGYCANLGTTAPSLWRRTEF
jgi:hypothetical protein